MKADRKIN